VPMPRPNAHACAPCPFTVHVYARKSLLYIIQLSNIAVRYHDPFVGHGQLLGQVPLNQGDD
jgi:hypothetical protein